MAAIKRSSGITVVTVGAVQIATPTARTRKRSTLALASVAPTYDGVVVAALQDQELQLVDAIPIAIERPKSRIKRAAPRAVRTAVEIDVPLQTGEQAVVLLEEEGAYRWIVDEASGTGSDAPKKRSARSGQAAARRKRFTIELQEAPSPDPRAKRVKRGWIADKLVGTAVAYVFRFALKLVGKRLVKFLERKVSSGLVAIRAPDPKGWQRVLDDVALARALPNDRPARVLLLVHGTFSSTLGSFGALAGSSDGRALLSSALSAYDLVLGFDHRTLSVDPAENARDMLESLASLEWPRPPQLDVVAFSRGGLVARSFIEELLPTSKWRVTLDRVVFVGCTNAGTQLAEPENWHRFADQYTNLAVSTLRAISLFPGAEPWATVTAQAIRGVGALVKVLASGAVTDNTVPGLAAMEPDGAFVNAINRSSAGQVTAADAKFYAITTDFDAKRALKDASARELPPKLLMRIADWGADELYGEPNDLVVHVRSMTHIGPRGREFIKGQLDYRSNATVYHTNYFSQPRTARQIAQWFELPPLQPEQVEVVKRRPAAAKLKRGSVANRSVLKATVDIASLLRSPSKPLRQSARATVRDRARKEGLPKSWPGRVSARRKAAKRKPIRTSARWAPKKVKSRVVVPRAPTALEREVGSAPASSVGLIRLNLGHSPVAAQPLKRGTPVRRTSRTAGEPRRASRAASTARGEKRKVDCYFLAEMDSSVVINTPAAVDVTISRELIEAAAGKLSSSGRAEVPEEADLIVEIADHREFVVIGKRRFDCRVPARDTPEVISFRVIGRKAGIGELSIQIRQGSVPLATLWLRPKIVARLEKPAERMRQKFELATFPPAQRPLDELRIIENVIGDAVTYTFMLDLHSLRLLKEFRSPPLTGPRDSYVIKVMNEIGDAWISKQGSVRAFEDDIRSIGGKMFSQLLPPELQHLLWTSREKIRSIQVFSQEPFIPWELVYLKNPATGRGESGSKFLGEMGLLRWVYDGFPSRRLRIRSSRVRYLLADYDDEELALPQAEAEGSMLQRVFPKAKPLRPTLASLNTVLKKRDAFDLLHICCHGHAAKENASQARLFLNGRVANGSIDGETLNASTVAETVLLAADDAEHRPIVVVNACESARPNREFNGMGGFAHAFVRARAGAFIGTHWSVGDTPAYAFVQALYEALAEKRVTPVTLSEAVMAARRVARGKDDATWLAYVVYGHPHAEVSLE